MGNQQQFKRTRIAPTPSGYLHLGNAFSFALTASLAKITGAKIMLRIDDMDQQRANKDFINDIFSTLDFLGIRYAEGPQSAEALTNKWSQLHRLAAYNDAITQLQMQNAVYACLCTRSQLQTIGYQCNCLKQNFPINTPGAAWRLKTLPDVPVTIKTYQQQIITTVLPQEMQNFIVRKKDGFPAYQMASLVDDLHFETDLIVRGADLWPSTIAQHYLANVLGLGCFSNVTFYHHDLLISGENTKLSKSAGATSIKFLRERGTTVTQVYDLINNMLKEQNSNEIFTFNIFDR